MSIEAARIEIFCTFEGNFRRFIARFSRKTDTSKWIYSPYRTPYKQIQGDSNPIEFTHLSPSKSSAIEVSPNSNNICSLILARVRLLLKKGHSCYRPRRTGERKRKSVRGCIVDQNLSALALVVIRKGAQEIEGVTDVNVPRRLGPKRASHIRKLFNLKDKEDDVRKYVIKRPLALKEGKKQRFQAPRIQRLVTPVVLQVS